MRACRPCVFVAEREFRACQIISVLPYIKGNSGKILHSDRIFLWVCLVIGWQMTDYQRDMFLILKKLTNIENFFNKNLREIFFVLIFASKF